MPNFVSEIVELITNNKRLTSDAIFGETSSATKNLQEIDLISDIRRRVFETPGIDPGAKSILILFYPDNEVGVRTEYHLIESNFDQIIIGGKINRLFLQAGFWGYQDFISQKNELQLIFTRGDSSSDR